MCILHTKFSLFSPTHTDVRSGTPHQRTSPWPHLPTVYCTSRRRHERVGDRGQRKRTSSRVARRSEDAHADRIEHGAASCGVGCDLHLDLFERHFELRIGERRDHLEQREVRQRRDENQFY